MATAELVPLTSLGNRYLRYLLSFGVTLAIGLAPLLGRAHVPLFTSIMEVFPLDLQGGLIPFASFVMTLPAVGVQFFAGEAIASRTVNRAFAITFLILVPLTLALYVVYSYAVVRVPIEGGRGTAAYIVGNDFVQDCPCKARGLRIASCIGIAISANPAQVSDCYPANEINLRRSILATLYLLVMLSFGALIGLLILKEQLRRSSKAP